MNKVFASAYERACDQQNNILDLLFAVDHALSFIDRFRDTETDPDSDIGEHVPNKACRVYAMLEEAAEAVNDDLEGR